MKTNKNNLGYGKVAIYAIIAEIVLIALQGLYIQFHNMLTNSTIEFNEHFIKNTSFYIFLGVGFIVFVILSYFIMKHIQTHAFQKMLTVFIASSLVEMLFYITMLGSDYEGVLLYSVMDRFIAVLFGVVIYYVGTKSRRAHEL